MHFRLYFFLFCMLCYLSLLAIFATTSLRSLSLVQGMFLIGRSTLLEFLIAYHLFEVLRARLISKLGQWQLRLLNAGSIFIIFALNILLVQIFHALLEPVPLSITLTALHSLFLSLPEQTMSSLVLALMTFSGLSLALFAQIQIPKKS